MTPRQRVLEAARVYGGSVVAMWCAGLLSGQIDFSDPDQPELEWIGGPHAVALLAQGDLVERGNDYWVRVWAARALLYIWHQRAGPAVVEALSDPAWRVREMAAKVVRRRELGEAADRLAELAQDPVTRVRAAAVRALALVGEGEHAELLRAVQDDPELLVREAAVLSLETLARRLERPL